MPSWKPDMMVLGEFLVEGFLNKGGQGAVYLLRSILTGSRFAVKRMLPESLGTEKNRKAFWEELITTMDLPPHPHLTPCQFFRSTDEGILLFSEYMEGGSLAQWISERRLGGLDSILDVTIQMAWGLHALHELGLIHRDVKPANVMMTTACVAKLADFGLAKPPRPHESRHEMTPEYCAPEQVTGDILSRQTDLWGWGVSVFELLAGGRFWSYGPSVEHSLDAYLSGMRSSKGTVAMPPALEQVLRRCFRPRPEDRWPTALEAALSVQEIYADSIGHKYPRPIPDFPTRSADLEPTRQRSDGTHWNNPREWLEKVLCEAGRDPRDAGRYLPCAAARSHKAQAIADLVGFDETRRILESLIGQGRNELEVLLAEMCLQDAVVRQAAGDVSGTLLAYNRAITALERQVTVSGAIEPLRQLAEAYLNKAVTVSLHGDNKTAEALEVQAAKIYERLVYAAGNTEAIGAMATAYRNLAVSRERLGRDAPASMLLLERSISILDRLVCEGEQFHLAGELALAYGNQAAIAFRLGDVPAAVTLLDRAIGIHEHAVDQAARPASKGALASAYQNKAIAMDRLGNSEAAMRLYDQAIAIREQLVLEKLHGDFQSDLAAAYQGKAILQGNTGDSREAVRLYDLAIAIYEQLVNHEGLSGLRGDLAQARMYRAGQLFQLDELERAYQEACEVSTVLKEEAKATDRSDLKNTIEWMNENAERLFTPPDTKLGSRPAHDLAGGECPPLDRFPRNRANPLEEVPANIDIYAIKDVIGRGPNSLICLAASTCDSRPVAIKLLRSREEPDDETKERFVREMGILKKLSDEHHEHIVSLRNCGIVEGALYFVMDYCDRGNVENMMKLHGGMLDLPTAGAIVLQALAGLAIAHRNEIVHRDIKPANILLMGPAPQLTAKLSDFGLAKDITNAGLSGMTITGLSMGTIEFMPREQLVDFKYMTPAGDVWSMAATFFYMLTGRPPRTFAYGSAPDNASLQIAATPIRRVQPTLPHAIADVIDKALEDDVRNRYPTAVEMRDVLADAVPMSGIENRCT